MDIQDKRVWVAGHRGLVGSALVRRLRHEGVQPQTIGSDRVDLRRQKDTEDWVLANKPHVVFIAAAKVGGIEANEKSPAEFLYDNLMIEANIIEAARLACVEKLVLLGSTCIYPKMAPQPIPENALLTGPLEPTNEWYAIAKIAGLKLVQAYRRQYGCDFITAQPTNLYGPDDNFDLATSHVLPALMRKAHEAKENHAAAMTVWGSGTPLREFLHVDDLADALVFLAKYYSGEEHINVGSGEEVSIRELAEMIKETVGYGGALKFDASKPDGTPRKLADVSKLNSLGWRSQIALREGLASTYEWLLEKMTSRSQYIGSTLMHSPASD